MLDVVIAFVAGIIVGGFVGVFAIALMVNAEDDDREARK